MKKFIPWVLLFAMLLTSIPLLILSGYYTLAKIIGFIVVILTTLSIRYWITKANKNKILKGTVVLNVNDRFEMDQLLPVYKTMSGSEKKNFERNVCVILSDIQFDNFDKSNPTKKSILAFATVGSLLFDFDIFRSPKQKVVVFKNLEEFYIEELNGVIHLFIHSNWCEENCFKFEALGNSSISESNQQLFKQFIEA